MINPIGEWICRTICAQIETWHGQGVTTVPIAINLSAVQFGQDQLIERLIEIVDEHGISPSLLTFEITESALMQDFGATQSALRRLKDLGFSLSLDDFGTGYSSLNYLRQLPIDALKIDVSFIKGITTNPGDAALVAAIIAMAHRLELNTIAEGVETKEQIEVLQTLGGDFSQGFYHSKPVPAPELAAILDTHGNSA